MARLPDLVRDSKLETQFLPHFSVETVHTYHESKPTQRRLVSVSEHWKRKKKIGGGGYANVWLETCSTLSRHGVRVRAVKQIETSGRFARIDFTRELETIAKFSHPKYEQCFVKSYGWYNTPKKLFITMEYLESGDLHDYLHERPPLPENQAKEISHQVLEGLQMMHENDFAHRDLKPRNLLIKSHPPYEWWIKIADFGISKRMEEKHDPSTTLRGSHGFIAPELYGFIQQGSIYSTDIWSFGEIIFQILTKQPTFNPIGQLSSYIRRPEMFPSGVLKDARVSKAGINFIHSLMQAKPEGRLTAEMAFKHPWLKHSSVSSFRPEAQSNPASELSEESEQDSSQGSGVEDIRDVSQADASRRSKARSDTDFQGPRADKFGSNKGKEKEFSSWPVDRNSTEDQEHLNRRAKQKAIRRTREQQRSRDEKESAISGQSPKPMSRRPQYVDSESRTDYSREAARQARLKKFPRAYGDYSNIEDEGLTSGTASNSGSEEEPPKFKHLPLRSSSRTEKPTPERSTESFQSLTSNRLFGIFSRNKKASIPPSKDNSRRSRSVRESSSNEPRVASKNTRSSYRDPKGRDRNTKNEDGEDRESIIIEEAPSRRYRASGRAPPRRSEQKSA